MMVILQKKFHRLAGDFHKIGFSCQKGEQMKKKNSVKARRNHKDTIERRR